VEIRSNTVGDRLVYLVSLELMLCCGAARKVCNGALLAVFRGVSRLGDWPLSVIVGLTLLVTHGWRQFTGWALISVTAVLIQKQLKGRYGRLRPCEQPQGPPQRAPIPDRGSFPSGHTLHAVMAVVVTASLVPVVAPVLAFVAFLIALSRVVLGVHYPSDVFAGAALGGIMGSVFLALV
jgi:undecaprenyl-diphosphatase